MMDFMQANMSKLQIEHAGALWNRNRAITQMFKSEGRQPDTDLKTILMSMLYMKFEGRAKVKAAALTLAPREKYNSPYTEKAWKARRRTLNPGPYFKVTGGARGTFGYGFEWDRGQQVLRGKGPWYVFNVKCRKGTKNQPKFR